MRPSRYAGDLKYEAGANGTVTLPVDAEVVHVHAQSSLATGSVVIFGGDAIPLVGAAAPDTKSLDLPFPENARPRSITGAKDIVFTDTVSFFVGYRTIR